jgi:hypothetical protein
MSDKPKVSKLSFKGDKPKKKKKRDRDDAGDDDDEEALAQAAAVSNDPLPGEGKLTSSGVVVMGHDTNFAEQIAVGDSLLVTVSDRFRNTHDDEMRVVNMVLGRSSLNLSAPFSCDLTAPTSFMVLKKAPDIEALKAARAAEKKRLKKLEEESSVVTCARVHCRLSFALARLFILLLTLRFSRSPLSLMFTDKVQKAGSGPWKTWTQVTERVASGTSREDMLARRAKEKHDRHC